MQLALIFFNVVGFQLSWQSHQLTLLKSMSIVWEKYSTIAFIDSNIALECLALEQLPWKEIDKTGILILVTPTVIQEVDSKKNHARLGDHARRFNRTLRPLLSGSDTVEIRSKQPQVDIALADCPAIDWGQYAELDRDEPDAKVAVQALCASGPDPGKKILISQDIRPLFLARKLGLKVLQIGENWLRPKEVSEAEKKADRLQKELNSIKSKEPNLEIEFDDYPSEIDTIRVRELSKEERESITQTIYKLNPMPEQDMSPMGAILSKDYSISDRYKKWMTKVIPKFVDDYERKIEVNYGQVEIKLKIKNSGQVPAENILIRLTVTGGHINDRYCLCYPGGPSAPRLRGLDHHNRYLHNSIRGVARVPGAHEFVVIEDPSRSSQAQISCKDFRHGYDFDYSVIAWVDPHATEFVLDVTVTASNLHGEVRKKISIQPKVREVCVSDIVDLSSFHLLENMPIAILLEKSSDQNDLSMFEFLDNDWDN